MVAGQATHLGGEVLGIIMTFGPILRMVSGNYRGTAHNDGHPCDRSAY